VPQDPDESLFEAGVIDSFGVMDLVAQLEESFDIKVPDDEMVPRRFETLNKIVAYVEAKRS
jgi:D-alanine--poly(phosphoribitol) ligase subunit 2